MIERLRSRGGSEDAVREVEHLAARGNHIDALSAVKDALGAPEFGSTLERALSDAERDAPDVVLALAELKPKLRAVLTTNLDHLLERAFGWPALASAPSDVATRRKVIVKLHGTLLDRSTWVFSRQQYDRAMFAATGRNDAFDALFRTCPILFVGYSLADPDLEQTFAHTRALAGEQPPSHYALVPKDSVAPFRSKKLQEAGLQLIPYDNADGRHAEAAALLRVVAGAPARATVAAPAGPPRYVRRPREEAEALRLFHEGLPVVRIGSARPRCCGTCWAASGRARWERPAWWSCAWLTSGCARSDP
jgi:hypothetical protein